MSKPHRTMSVLTAGKRHVQVQLTADQRTLDNIASAKASYQTLLGHGVSTSLVLRRAVDLLARYLPQIKSEDWVQDELAYLVRSIR